MTDQFRKIAEDTHFNIYLSPMWNNTGHRFAEEIVKECVACCGSQADKKNILKRFGLSVPSDVKYPGEDPQGHETQYTREYNIPK